MCLIWCFYVNGSETVLSAVCLIGPGFPEFSSQLVVTVLHGEYLRNNSRDTLASTEGPKKEPPNSKKWVAKSTYPQLITEKSRNICQNTERVSKSN